MIIPSEGKIQSTTQVLDRFKDKHPKLHNFAPNSSHDPRRSTSPQTTKAAETLHHLTNTHLEGKQARTEVPSQQASTRGGKSSCSASREQKQA